MRKSSAEFECECKAKTDVDFIEPEVFRPTLQDIVCKGCSAEWQMRFRRDLKSHRILASHKLTRGSRKLGEVLEKRNLEKIRRLPQKKAPQFFVK